MIDRYTYPEMGRVWSPESKVAAWLRVEIAVCEAWARQGIVPFEALAKIREARCDLRRMEELEQESDHDVIAFLRAIGETIGEESRFVHLGLTSSDVVDTGLSLQVLDAADLLLADMTALMEVLARRAREHRYTPMIGRTHGVHAEPTSFGLKLALWWDETRRNRERLARARAEMAVGKFSGAVGTHANVPPEAEEYACSLLGLEPAPVSSQIIQRDRHAYFLATLAVAGSSLDKFATEIRHLQRTEVREVEEPFGESQQGSSAMPHKRNPHKSERISGLSRLLRGYAVTGFEDVALWHERDISHSSAERVVFPDACIVLDFMLRSFTQILEGLRVFPERMMQNLELTRGNIFSQRVLLALIDKGMGRQQAYKLVQRHAMEAWETGRDLLSLLQADPAVTAVLTPEELTPLFDYRYHLRYVDEAFERLGI